MENDEPTESYSFQQHLIQIAFYIRTREAKHQRIRKGKADEKKESRGREAHVL
jgi:hypothetical protein